MEKLINNAPFALVLVFLVIGFVLLIKGADFFVEGSSSVAKRLHVPSIIIGLTIVAMGTSLPETAVSVSASITGNNELAVSNVVGSNIFNLMVVIGVCAMIATVEVARETIRRDIPLSLICAGLLLLLGTMGLGDQANMTLGHFDGVIFIGLFAGYIFYMIRIALKANKEGKKVEIEGGSDEEIKLISVPLSIVFIGPRYCSPWSTAKPMQWPAQPSLHPPCAPSQFGALALAAIERHIEHKVSLLRRPQEAMSASWG